MFQEQDRIWIGDTTDQRNLGWNEVINLLYQSSYEECGEAVQPMSKGSSDPQQCQYWNTLPDSGVFMVPPLYTLSNFLLVSPEDSRN